MSAAFLAPFMLNKIASAIIRVFMNQNTKIFYFTGTGNTAILAGLFQKQFEKANIAAELFPTEEILNSGKLPSLSNCYILLGFPVHAFNAPPNVFDFVHRLPPGMGKKIILFKNAGDPMKNGAFTWVKKVLRKKGYIISYEASFVMPSNTFLKYPPGLSYDLYLTAKLRIASMVKEIIDGKCAHVKSSFVIDILAKLFITFKGKGTKYFGRKIELSKSKCLKCGQCAASCPVNNIIQNMDGYPVWGTKCALCMRCMYICKQDAIRPGYLKFFRIASGYNAIDMMTPSIDALPYKSRLIERIHRHTVKYL
ncbi:EFR1 family ferrodoxin [bacterium]|nr:EFR1 family ferrodoxin [bacterium]